MVAADVTGEWTAPLADLWHDRALFHFLTDPEDRKRYVGRLIRMLKPGGQAIIATFALDGPLKCSGLPIVRYSPETLAAELGPRLELVDSVREEHRTPMGGAQMFSYSRFMRTASEPGASWNEPIASTAQLAVQPRSSQAPLAFDGAR
jgi:hypothetical protein